jgi:small-conductance mechanosensitive channel
MVVVLQYALTWVKAQSLARVIIYTVIPLLLLNAFDVLVQIVEVLESYALELGNFHLSLYDVLRVGYFGVILFWLGKESNRIGKSKIRQQRNLDTSTKELIAKLFEVGVYIVVFLVLLNILGINLTTLAVLGGAIGVGIGFGLQSIASNFISGVIILLDRSLSIGDYIELGDGRSGTIREVNLRAVTLETYDGKDIVVPNDVFFSDTFTNWTHKNQKQRYAIDYSVAYSTDLDKLFPLVKAMLCEHPKVISGDAYLFEEQPDIEISGFGDNGIDLHIEFWMEAIDDGEHRVGGDLLYSLWQLMKANGFEFPFPQREVRLLKDNN